MRQFFKLGPLLLWAIGASSVDAKLQVYDDRDSRIEWTPADLLTVAQCGANPGNVNCRGIWWTEGGRKDYQGTVTDTLGPDTSMRFSFKGSAITIYGVRLNYGALGTVTVNGKPQGSFNCTSPDGSLQRQMELFTLDGLDPNVIHSVVVAYDPNGRVITGRNDLWLGIDYILVDENDETPSGGSASPDSSLPSSATVPTGTTTVGSMQQKRLSAGELAGIAIGACTIGASIVLLVYLWYRRNRTRQEQQQRYKGPLEQVSATRISAQSISGPPTLRTAGASVNPNLSRDASQPEPFTLHMNPRAAGRPPSYTKR